MKLYIIILIVFILGMENLYSMSDNKDTNKLDTNLFEINIPLNLLYSELLGNTLSLIGINYERLIFNLDSIIVNNSLLYFRTGVNFNIIPPHISIPFMLNAVLFNENSLELGIGFFYDYVYYKRNKQEEDETLTPWSNFPAYPDDRFKFTFTIGFRHQPNNGGFTFRTGYTPIIFKNGNYWNIWGFSFGFAW